MNYYNPYFYTAPSLASAPKLGLFSRLFGRSGVTLSGIINGTQRALNFANQAIPLVKQVKPMIGNAKTMFKVMNEFKRTEKPKQNIKINNSIIEKQDNVKQNISEPNNQSFEEKEEGPTFFV